MKRRTVDEVMTSDVITVTQDTSFSDIVALLAEHRINAVPVIDPDGLMTGVVTESDLLRKEEFRGRQRQPAPLWERLQHRRAKAKAKAIDAGGVMTSPAVTLPADASIPQATRVLAGHRIKQAPVMDAEHRLVGPSG